MHLNYFLCLSRFSQPLLPIEYNGPGLEYKVSYRKLGVEEHWQEHMVKRNHIIVRNTPTFVPYEVMVQARNALGWAPEPKVFTLYSGEDSEYLLIYDKCGISWKACYVLWKDASCQLCPARVIAPCRDSFNFSAPVLLSNRSQCGKCCFLLPLL